MVSVLLAAFAVTASPAVVPARPDDPRIRISLNSDAYYERGDRAKVQLRVAADGYVVVLRADADGRVRVLFPLDPGDDDFVRGGKDYELRGRGDRETFFVDDGAGTGTVLAARSATPFHYDRFVRGDHWDYRVLASDRVRDDPEAGLLDLVDAMADSGHFDYDVVSYAVAGDDHGTYSSDHYDSSYPCYACGVGYGYGYGSGLHVSIGFGFGWPYGYGYYYPYSYPYYYPYSYYPYSYYPYSYYPYSYNYPHSYYPYPYGYGPYSHGGGFVFKQPTAPPPLILPRDRMPRTTPGAFDRPVAITGLDGRRSTPAIAPRRSSPPDARQRQQAMPSQASRDSRNHSEGRRLSERFNRPPERSAPRAAAPRREASSGSRAAPRSWSGSSRSSGGSSRSFGGSARSSGGSSRSFGGSTRSSGARPSNQTSRRH